MSAAYPSELNFQEGSGGLGSWNMVGGRCQGRPSQSPYSTSGCGQSQGRSPRLGGPLDLHRGLYLISPRGGTCRLNFWNTQTTFSLKA